MREVTVKRGDIFMVDFGRNDGSKQGGLRPAICISNNRANRFSPVVSMCPITTKFSKRPLPTHVKLNIETCGMKYESQILTEQIYPINKSELRQYIGRIDSIDTKKLNEALEISIEVGNAEDMYNDKSREIKVAKEKSNTIFELDSFIKIWIDRGRNIEEIYDVIEERTIKLKELDRFCKSYELNYKDYYKPIVMSNGGKENIRMVG